MDLGNTRLMNPNLLLLTDTFVQEQLGIKAKIACKKLVMAAKRLKTTREEFLICTEFDCNNSSN
jgi:hypothetical protein